MKTYIIIQIKNETVLLDLSKFIYNAMHVRTTLLNMFLSSVQYGYFLVFVLYKLTN